MCLCHFMINNLKYQQQTLSLNLCRTTEKHVFISFMVEQHDRIHMQLVFLLIHIFVTEFLMVYMIAPPF